MDSSTLEEVNRGNEDTLDVGLGLSRVIGGAKDEREDYNPY